MTLTVAELRQELELIEEQHPDAEVKVDPPWHGVLAVHVREVKSGTVVELSH